MNRLEQKRETLWQMCMTKCDEYKVKYDKINNPFSRKASRLFRQWSYYLALAKRLTKEINNV